MHPNLTEEQTDLLKTMVEVYDSGCKGPFTLALSHGTSRHLTYSGHPPLELLNVGVLDLKHLASEGLIILDNPVRNLYSGKPTAKGISWAHQFHTQNDQHRPVTSAEKMQLEASQKSPPPPPIKNHASMPSMSNYRFKIALSFPGEHRSRVQNVASLLTASVAKSEIL
jgi:hypothetical protein